MTDVGLFRAYVHEPFRKSSLARIAQANKIIAEYEGKNFSLTIRQLHYQLVSRDLYENTAANYNSLVNLISRGRMAGLVSWTAIEDRGRNLRGHTTWGTPLEAAESMRQMYKRDLWERQPNRVEVWVEKQALEGVIGSICDELRVDFFATKGYNSQSEQWRAGRRFASCYNKGQRPVVLHLGDHDPSGIDMTRDNRERLSLFCGTEVLLIRLALNMAQVEELRPPPNFAKEDDSRFRDYMAKYGDESWELDALSPEYIQNLISSAVTSFRDEAIWETALERENEDKDELDMVVERLK